MSCDGMLVQLLISCMLAGFLLLWGIRAAICCSSLLPLAFTVPGIPREANIILACEREAHVVTTVTSEHL